MISLTQKFSQEEVEIITNKNYRYHPTIVRISLMEEFISNRITGNYKDVSQQYLPFKNMVVYGTSITQGRAAMTPDLNYQKHFSKFDRL